MSKQSEQPERIAYVIGKMWAGGVEAVVFNYYRHIDHSRFQFDFYYDSDSTVGPSRELMDMGARFIELPPYNHLKDYLRELRRHLREENYRIIHSHINTLSVFPLYAAWREHIPVRIAHNHSVPGGKEFERNALKMILRCFSKVFATDYLACSEKTGRWMFGNRTFDQGKVYVVKNAIEIGKFRRSWEETEELKHSLGLEGKFVVGHVGRFTYAKNHPFLLDVFKEVLKLRPDAVLLLVGDGELHDEIVEGAKEREILDRIVMTGKVTDPEKYYGLADVIVLPSFFEGLSLATVESQFAGVPSVISKAVPKEAIISDGCIYRDLKDPPEEWAKAVMTAVEKPVRLNEAAGLYDIHTQAPLLEEYYTGILESRF